jgi:VWFA-related protein
MHANFRRIFLLALLTAVVTQAGGLPLHAAGPAPRPAASGQRPAEGVQRPAESGQRPSVTFKVEVNYVEVDAVVTDAQGQFVPGLTRDDFQVLEDGKPEQITAFSQVALPITKSDPPLFRKNPIEPDVRTNHEEFNGRVILLVLDDLQTDFRRTARVKAAARQFIQRYVGANDMVAVVTTGGRSDAGQEFTTSHARLLAAVDRFLGQKIPSATMTTIDDYYRQPRVNAATATTPGDTSQAERGFRARSTLRALAGLSDYLAGIRGRRKALVWVGEGIDYNIDDPFTARDATVVRDAMQEVVAAATRANVSIYGVDARGLGAGLDEAIEIDALPDDPTLNLGTVSLQNEVRRAQDSLRSISDQTGGFAIVNQNDLNAAFGRVIQDNSTYYVLGYYASNDKRDGKFRKVQVRVTRPGLQVRARNGYVAPKGRAAAPELSKIEKEVAPALRDAMNSPIPSSGLGLAVFAAPFQATPAKASVALVLEFDPGGLKFVESNGTFNDDLEVVIQAIDAKGKTQDGAHDSAPLRLTRPTYASVTNNGFRMTRRLELSPGRYQLRVAVREANGGATGSLACDLDVPDFSKPPLAMSGIAIASAWAANRTVTANPDAGFKDVMPAQPTAARQFPNNDTMAYFVEVYDNVTATHRVAIKTTILGDDGRIAFATADERRSEDLAGKRGAFVHTGSIPLKSIAPGRYVLRIEAQSLLSNGANAVRELEFQIR